MIRTTIVWRTRWWLPAILPALVVIAWLWVVLRHDAIHVRVAGREEVVLEGNRVDPRSYPSVIDPDSPSRNFETSGQHVYLYFVRIHMEDCRPTAYRDLVRVPIEIRKGDG